MRFHELMKETWKEGLGKKYPQNHPQKTLGLDFAWKMKQETLYYSSIAWEPVHVWKKRGKKKKKSSIATMSHLKTLVSK